MPFYGLGVYLQNQDKYCEKMNDNERSGFIEGNLKPNGPYKNYL